MNDHLKNSMRGELDARISETEAVGHTLADARNITGVCGSHGALVEAVATQSRAICTLLRCERARLVEVGMKEAEDSIRMRGVNLSGRAALILSIALGVAIIIFAATGKWPW